MQWRPAAERLAGEVTHPYSRWWGAVTETPRHVFVPRWFEPAADADARWGWSMRAVDGPSDPVRWRDAAYSDRTLITKLGAIHADDAGEQLVSGRQPTSSGTNPSTVVAMLRHGRVFDGADVLDVATGTGYSAALLSHRLGDKRVTSVDVDEDLVARAAERLDAIGLHPSMHAVDATGPLDGDYDRVIAMVSVRPIPASWLTALRPGGRIVAAIANTTLLLTAEKRDDGSAIGRVERDVSGFMPARSSAEYPAGHARWDEIRDAEGETIEPGWLPLWNIPANSDVATLLELAAPGVHTRWQWAEGRRLTVWLTHEDGSWARATGTHGTVPQVHQSGPRHLWDIYEQTRATWNMWGINPALGAQARIEPDGTIHLSNDTWKATLTA